MRCKTKKNNIKIRNIEEYPPEDGKKKKDSLQAERTDDSPSRSLFTGIRRVFLCISEKGTKRIRRRGSLTVEAAIAVPVFLLTVSSMLGILDIYRVQAMVKTSLRQSALELGMYAYAADKGEDSPVGAVSSAACALYARSKLPDLGSYVRVSTAGSSYENGVVDLVARIEYRLPLALLPLPPIRLTNESRVNAWVGGERNSGVSGGGQWEELVYVSENESVYHTSPSCTHMELAVHQGKLERVEELRNTYGQKYHCCEKCGSPSGNGMVYYTEKGNRYHSSETCSGLKRTVRLVKKSDVPAICQCERCRAKEQKGK